MTTSGGLLDCFALLLVVVLVLAATEASVVPVAVLSLVWSKLKWENSALLWARVATTQEAARQAWVSIHS